MKKLAGQDRLTEDNVKEALREVRLALLEADVNYTVAKKLVADIRAKALGQDVLGSLTPAQQVVKIVNEELTDLLGGHASDLNLDVDRAQTKGMSTVMVMGLQGSGKTTFCGKLALRLVKEGRKPMLVAADIYRPAAIDQLQVIAEQVGVPVHSDRERKNAAQIVKLGLRKAKDNKCDCLIVDTAGRLHIDDTLMSELESIDKTVPMDEKLLVLDAMTGQEAVNIATTFAERLDFDGAVLTKMDGDARGGAALSVLEVTGRPVKMVGIGEKMEDLEVFHPDRMAGRILGMGDVLTLIEQAEEKMDLDQAENLASRFAEGEFNLEDFQAQIKQMKKMGPLKGILKMMPGHEQRHAGQGQGGRQPVRQGRGDHQFDDLRRAAQAGHHQRFAAQADCARKRDHGLAGQQAAQAVPGHAADDATDQHRRRPGSVRQEHAGQQELTT